MEVEVKEREIIEERKKKQIVMKRLKNEGINIEIDDFGKGYQRIRYINKLKIKKVKVER